MDLGFGDDLRACAQIDTLQVVPAFVDGRIAEAKKG
jgi:phosphosulfolactate phosphohydrolase-like enzyme